MITMITISKQKIKFGFSLFSNFKNVFFICAKNWQKEWKETADFNSKVRNLSPRNLLFSPKVWRIDNETKVDTQTNWIIH